MSKEVPGNKFQLSSRDSNAKYIFTNQAVSSLCRKIESKEFIKSVLIPLFNQFIAYEHKEFKEKKRLFLTCAFDDKNIKNYFEASSSITSSQKWIRVYKDQEYLPLVPTIQLSKLEPGSFIVPHTDVGNKVATLMIYLPQDESQCGDNELSTIFYYRNDHQIMRSHPMAQDNNFRSISTFFGYGATYLFFRSDSIWHSVSIPEAYKNSRYSININFNIAI